jgi:hypothetical protein
MSVALVTLPPRPFALDRTHLCLQPGRETSFDEWAAFGADLGTAHDAVQFWIGDWMNLGDGLFGEQAAQAWEDVGLELATLQQYAWVARLVTAERRIGPPLSWSHHRAVADLPPHEQTRWLEQACIGEGGRPWSVGRLTRQLSRQKAGVPTTLWLVVECHDADDQQALKDRMEGEGRTVRLHDGRPSTH